MSDMMKAIVQQRYGQPADVLELREVELPRPADDEVLVRVHASSVNPADWMTLVGRPYAMRPMFGLARPKHRIPGKDVAGVVEAVGSNITGFAPSDEVFGELAGGAYAEYVAADAHKLAHKPPTLDFAEAAAVPLAGVTALQGIRDAGGVCAGHHVVVNGASGGVGTFAVQIAKSFGAHVTGVCHTRNVDLVRSLGADEVVDYTRADLTQTGLHYDVIFDLIGNYRIRSYREILRPGGVYVAATGRPGGSVLGPLPFIARVGLGSLRGGPKRIKVFAAKSNADDLAEMNQLIESDAVTPVIDKRFDLPQTADALAHQGEGHTRGKTVITV
jgi:NADPH:quinone reductase-like Zn-dependent oxidoreductase